jgi:FKBP-type peptidyl-prolyl cis-trans isomerase FkpA
MKRYFLLIGGLLLVLVSACRKVVDTDTQAATDDKKIQAYIAANHLNMTKDPAGFYYQIVQSNPGAHPDTADTVQVTYTGKLLNGTIFDSENVEIFAVDQLVVGAQDALQLIGANGKAPYGRITFILPSRLGYGHYAYGAVPANSPLVFTFDLIGFYQ